MAVNVHSSSHSIHHSGNASTGLAGFGRKLLANAGLFMRSVQMARMTATLSGMSDAQLEQIGIARTDIPAYAERLMETS